MNTEGNGVPEGRDVHKFLRRHDRFEFDREVLDMLRITVCPDGYLKCVRPQDEPRADLLGLVHSVPGRSKPV